MAFIMRATFWCLAPTIATTLLASTPARAQAGADSARLLLKSRIREASISITARRSFVAVARSRRAAAGRLPAAVLSAEVEEVPGGLNLPGAQSMRVDFSQDLLPRGKSAAERGAADIDIVTAQTQLEAAEKLLDATVDQLVSRAAGNAVIAARLASEDSLLREAEVALSARFAVADARYVDVLRLRTERLRVESEVRGTLAEYRLARARLTRLGNGFESSLASLIDSVIARERSRLARAAPETYASLDTSLVPLALKLSALEVQRAEAEQHVALADLRPAFTPALGLQRFGETGAKSFGVTLGFSLSLPFTAARATRARIGIADTTVAFARSLRSAHDASLRSDLVAAADEYEIARAQAASFGAALLRGAREEREAALSAYRTGTLSLIELLDFERALAQAETGRIRAELDLSDALFRYTTISLGGAGLGESK